MGSRLRDTVRYLFELFCEVSPGDQTREPYIIRKYPESYKNEEELKNVPKFTFPCKLENYCVQCYSFVLTSLDSKYTFCFCRYDPKSNSALVLLSHLPWHDQFYKLLHCIANLMHGTERGELTSLLEACRIRPPMPGHTLKVTYNAGQNVFSCQSPDNKLPSIPENCNLTEYFSAMDAKCMAGLWAALLHERRVAIVASKPSRLSACVQAANATLFPMSWQHIFIPILPKHLVDYLLAPMPFLIGVPRSVMEGVRTSEIGDVVVLDIDKNELKTPFQDLESLPPDLVASLKKALSDKNALGDAVSRAFLRALVCLIGGYRDVIRIEKGQLITFNPEAFVRTRKNMQPFLKKILQSQIFQQFIDERLELLNSGRGFNDEFEVECNLYAEKLGTGSGQRLKQQYRDWAKTVKKEGGAFFKNVKDKVRQGGRNVKSAVRGLKNRMPKTGSRPSSVNTTDESRFSCGSETPISSDSSDSSPAHEVEPRDLPEGRDPAGLRLDLRDLPEGRDPAGLRLDLRDLPEGRDPAGLRLDLRDLPEGRDPAGLRLDLRDLPEGRDPAGLRLDLLTEMEYLFKNNQRRDSYPNSSRNSEASFQEKTRTLSPCPPRLPERPKPQTHYPIISTRKLVDLSDAPALPPRAAYTAASNAQFVSNITKDDGDSSASFHTSTICFSEGKDKAKLKLTLSSNQRKLPHANVSAPCNGSTVAASSTTRLPLRPPPLALVRGKIQESCGSDTDLIKLDDSPTNLEDFDPLKLRDKNDKVEPIKTSTDSALLRDYGIDFSRFGLVELPASSSGPARPDAPSAGPKGWTTFN